MATFTGGKKLEAKLRELKRKVDANTVSVGFLEESTYPDDAHTPVAQVAFWLNYGTSNAPPRPFFTGMIAKEMPTWGDKLAKIMRSTDYDVKKSLGLMGEGIRGQLQKSIVNLNSPELSPVTLMIRKMLIDNPSLQVNKTVVGVAAAKVAAGESSAGASTKVGVYTGHLLNSAAYRVEAGL